MPIYEFRCAQCGHVSEMLIRTNLEKEALSCPECGSPRVERLISAPNIPKTTVASATRCGKGTPCCGSSTPCEKPPCS
ncbi:MAG: zinc ribbon domain-containing protein [Candidatus Abyssobacteria bacterium SURF_17]|uniref:Zinc ribbon domain-containing protein n=1 Tax=Candidatus Abyssobacteria bacterium SURF_17 TaxID=2093361 RepID=A0A419EPI2_9BACT|nr:MAG: zinc ribbon domain-containing protein [Candidatus Abyssubacteria bacterium SURF_17]